MDEKYKPPQFRKEHHCPTCDQKIEGEKSWLELARLYEEIATSGSVAVHKPNLRNGAAERAAYCYEAYLNELWYAEEVICNFRELPIENPTENKGGKNAQ